MPTVNRGDAAISDIRPNSFTFLAVFKLLFCAAQQPEIDTDDAADFPVFTGFILSKRPRESKKKCASPKCLSEKINAAARGKISIR